MNIKLKLLFIVVLLFISHATFAQKKAKDTASVTKIEEVVILGFGQKKAVKELTGSISTMTSKSIQDLPVASIDKMLQGRITGVQTGSSSGQPGGGVTVRVRGISSINGATAPIFILDGVRIMTGGTTMFDGNTNNLANLDPNNVESITVLKDAVSTAVYGADAGAGIVVITTKSGKEGKAKFSLSFNNGVNDQAVSTVRPFTAQEYKEYLRDAYNNAKGKNFSIEEIANGAVSPTYADIFKSPHNTVWGDAIRRNGYQSNSDFSIGGGTNKFTYYVSANMFDQNSIIRNSFFKRLAYSTKLTYQATEKLKVSADFQISHSKTRSLDEGGSSANPMSALYSNRPTDPSRNPDGSWYFNPETSVLSNQNYNHGYLLDNDYKQVGSFRGFANLNLEYKILKHLAYRFVFSTEYVNAEETKYLNPIHGDGYKLKGSKRQSFNRYFYFNVHNILDYSEKFGVHNIGASIIQEATKSNSMTLLATGINAGTPTLITLSNFVTPYNYRGDIDVSSRYGYAVTGHYDYDQLILIDGSYRRDVLSQFLPGKKGGNFWSVGLGVNLMRFNFLRVIESINMFKFRASYGKLGNQVSTNPYATFGYTTNYDGRVAADYSGVMSPNLSWESVNPFNVGVDLELLKGRVKISAEYYHKKTKDLIFDVPLFRSQGVENMVQNIGSLENRGFEFSVNADIFRGDRGQFNWSIGGNLSTLDNQVTKLYGGSITNIDMILKVGESAKAFYLRKWAGVDHANGNPLWYINGRDGETTNDYRKAQRAVQGSSLAKLFGGFNNSIAYRGFSLDLQFTYGAGGKVYDYWAQYGYGDGLSTLKYVGYGDVMGDYWTPNNTNASNPKPMSNNNKNSNGKSTRFLYNNDFIRLSNARLAYSFKGDVLKGSGLSNVQIYVLANNAWTHRFDARFKFDPELNVIGDTSLNLPVLKSFIFGINLSF